MHCEAKQERSEHVKRRSLALHCEAYERGKYEHYGHNISYGYSSIISIYSTFCFLYYLWNNEEDEGLCDCRNCNDTIICDECSITVLNEHGND